MAVTKRLRFEILRRDNHACRYCGATAPDVKLTVDHVKPAALGGTNDPGNLVTACAACNSGKSSTSPDTPIVDDVATDALRWGVALEFAANVQLGRLAEDNRTGEWFTGLWEAWKNGAGETAPRPADWAQTVLRFLALGLPGEVIAESVKLAMANSKVPLDRVWRYFCGICWRRVDELQEIASAALIAQEGHA